MLREVKRGRHVCVLRVTLAGKHAVCRLWFGLLQHTSVRPSVVYLVVAWRSDQMDNRWAYCEVCSLTPPEASTAQQDGSAARWCRHFWQLWVWTYKTHRLGIINLCVAAHTSSATPALHKSPPRTCRCYMRGSTYATFQVVATS